MSATARQPKITVLPYMGKHREVIKDEDPEVLFDPHGPMGQFIADTVTEEDSNDPLDILLAAERWIGKHYDMTLFECVVFGIKSKSKL